MTEYTITVTYTVDARDHDDTVEIAKSVVQTIKDNSEYKLRDVQTQTIERS